MKKTDKVIFISVVRDFELYNKLVRYNQWNRDAEYMWFDNNVNNIGVAERYNSFLNTYNYSIPAWFVFCHEDWEARECISKKLKNLPHQCLYGPIGAQSIITHDKIYRFVRGKCNQSFRDGSNCTKEKGIMPSGRVDTFDCQCLIVHSSLIQEYGLRFDERLTFDLYVEDFCINAYENHGILSKAINIRCQHYSPGNISERFMQLKNYISSKYSGTYTTIAGGAILGNDNGLETITYMPPIFRHPEKYWILYKYRNK